MATSALRSIVESRVQANWTLTPIDFDNTVFTVPSTAWVRIIVGDAKTVQAELGGPVKRRRSIGVISGDVYAPVGKGSDEAKALADAMASLFRDFKSSSLTCDEPTVKTLGEQNGWYRVTVSVPYRYDFFV